MFKTFRIRAALCALALGSALIAPLAADALTATGTMSVSATVSDTCTTSATAVGFGTWSFAAASTATSTITVTCTSGAAVASVGLDNGLQPVGTTPPVRQLKAAGAATIAYTLYQDSGYATAWTTTAYPAATTYTAGAAASTFTVYAKAPAGTNVIAGTYTDTVGITVTYT